MRAIWKGAISFGLVNVPIKLMTATRKNNIKFTYLHAECNTPIKNKRYCPRCGREVEYEELVKGYEYEENKYVILKDDDFDNIPVKSTKTIDIIDFVKLEEIDPVYYIKTYYLQPAAGGEKPYLLLKNAMDNNKRVAISKITIRKRESLAVIRVLDNLLALETMYFADEVNSTDDIKLDDIEKEISISKKEEKLARDIIENLTAKFEPEKYDNEYREELMKIIRNKIEGEEVEAPEVITREEKVVNLMEKLKASVEATEKSQKKKRKKKPVEKTG